MTGLYKPTMMELSQNFLDITAPTEVVEIRVREDKSVIWINVDSVCVLRICRIPKLEVT